MSGIDDLPIADKEPLTKNQKYINQSFHGISIDKEPARD